MPEPNSLGETDPRAEKKKRNLPGESPTWHLERPSTAERQEAANANCGFIPAERTLASVIRGFHYKGDRAEVRRGWHVSKEWKRKYVPKLPWKPGEPPFDPRVDVKHLRKVKGDASKKYEASLRFNQEGGDEEWDEELDWDDEGMGDMEGMEGMVDFDMREMDEEREVDEDLMEGEGDDLMPVPIAEAGTFAWKKQSDNDPWHDITGRRILKHDGDGRLVNPGQRPGTAQSFTSQETDHQHDNMLSFLVDDRFFKGKEPMRCKRGVKETILHKIPTKNASKAPPPVAKPKTKLTKDGAARLSEESRRMEQNRILRHVTEEEFQRETERRMMLATIANPQKRLMLHRYFEEQRAIAAKKIEALVRAQEHAMLTDMKLTSGADLRGPNFEKTYEPPSFFPKS